MMTHHELNVTLPRIKTQTICKKMSAFTYRQAQFLLSVAKLKQLPDDLGYEVAFAGRSNAGKSSALNCLTENKGLARTSKTPGRTQLINLFTLDAERRLVDLPGYGYAKVPQNVKDQWQKTLALYLESRQCLRGLILLMDVRHPLKALDEMMVHWAIERELPVHILLTKADKLKRGPAMEMLKKVVQRYELCEHLVSAQLFSSLKKTGVDEAYTKLNQWFDLK